MGWSNIWGVWQNIPYRLSGVEILMNMKWTVPFPILKKTAWQSYIIHTEYHPVQKVSDLRPGKKSCVPGGAQFLIPFEVGPLWPHTLSPTLGTWDLWWDKVALGRCSPSTSVSSAIVVRSTNYSTVTLIYHPGKMYNRPMCGRSTGTYTNLGDLQRGLMGVKSHPTK
jgi:hypothetical protein